MTGMAALLGGLGAVAIAFGLLIALLSVFQPVGGATLAAWIWGNLVVGALLLAAALVSGFDGLRERLSSGEGRRVGRYGTSAILQTVLGLVILGILGALAELNSVRFDWTEQKIHTLTDQTREVLAGLERDVEATAFFSELEATRARDLLERYDYASERFGVRFVDPNARPDLVAALEIDEAELAEGLVRITLGDDSVDVSELDEESLTNALVSLSRTSDRKVYFLTGHNERPTEGEEGRGKEGLRQAAQALRNENYRVEELLIAGAGAVPEDADALVVAGPTRPLPPEELAALERYLERGGSLLVMLDPRAKTNLGDWLAERGVRAGNDIIVDLELAFFQQYMSPFAGSYAEDHPITSKMGGQRNPVLFHLARSVSAGEARDGGFETLVYTGEKSWAEKDLERLVRQGEFQYGEDDEIGPVPVAVAGSLGGEGDGEDAGGRLVVVGDSDFATNEFVARYGGNRDLFVNSVNWLLGDVEAISIRPHRSRASRFTGSQEDVRAIQYLSLFVLPEAIAVAGVVAWWSRRKGPGR